MNAAAGRERLRVFGLVVAVTLPLLYALGDLAALPLFTFHPASLEFDWGWVPARRDEGPAMYWYGWIALAGLGAGTLGVLGAWLAPRALGRLSLNLAWIVPLALVPLMIRSLSYYWRW